MRGTVHLEDKLNPCNPEDHEWRISSCGHITPTFGLKHNTYCVTCKKCFYVHDPEDDEE